MYPNLNGHDFKDNRILAALSVEEMGRLLPYIEKAEMRLGDVISRPDEPIRYVYSPHRGTISVIAVPEDGAQVEVGVVGSEGMFGTPIVLGTDTSPLLAIARHVGIIPDGNRRWADERGLARRCGYAAGVEPGIRLLDLCRNLGINEAIVYGFTKENVHRPSDQVEAFRAACVEFCLRAVRAGAALLVVSDSASPAFPDTLRPFTERRSRGDISVNLLANYDGWQWDLFSALEGTRAGGPFLLRKHRRRSPRGAVSRIDLVVRWGGRRRLSGFLPFQCAYADLYVIDTLWPEMNPEEFLGALSWYQKQDTTLGG